MECYRSLLVGVGLGEQDSSTIRYAGLISRLAGSQRAYFVHVTEDLTVPAELREKYPQLDQTPEDAAQQRVRELVRQHFDAPAEMEVGVEIREGAPLAQLLHLSRHRAVDLVIVGRTGSKMHPGKLPEKLARKAPCSVLIVPEGAEARISKILVPVDFSDHCAYAVERALALAATTNAAVQCLHVYNVPVGYQKTGVPHDEFAEGMRKISVSKYQSFVDDHRLIGLTLDARLVLDRSPEHAITEVIRADGFDLLVMSTRGRNAGAAVLLGSVTEHVIGTADIPLLAVKRKGANMTILEALLNL